MLTIGEAVDFDLREAVLADGVRISTELVFGEKALGLACHLRRNRPKQQLIKLLFCAIYFRLKAISP
ncbi:hypothetical protein [Gluconacetobacter dulcium]|uniref:hypothetical protein n=1 Tax=Gluconacetobacter dulcium TaxID=2729096 RepID=UPI001C80D017|nr:hypothetical protein [Gluconacetobacter dulcium]